MLNSHPSLKKSNLPLVFALSLFCTAVTVIYSSYRDNLVFPLLIAINSFITLYYLLYDSKRPYTIAKLVNFFILVFFILANAIQYANKSIVLTFRYSFDEFDYILFQFIVLIILLTYNPLHDYFQQKSIKKNKYKCRIIEYSSIKLMIISVVATTIILFHYNFNVFSLLFRGLTQSMMEEYGINQSSGGSSSLAMDLIFSKLIRSIPWAVYVLSCFVGIKKRDKIVLFILTLITVFPTGISRNAAAMYWLPIFILLFKKYLKGNRFIYIMLVGIFIVFPFMDNFRYFTGQITYKFSLDYLDSMNMDASQIFMATMKTNKITWGYQLLGSIFFFVPRSIWTTKPVGSGAFLVDEMNGSFSNVSMPFFSEGFINFGLPGILIFTIFLSWLTGKLDGKYWKQKQISSKLNPNDGYYLILLSAIVFIMRGDLMSSFAFTVGISLAYYLVMIIAKSKSVIKNDA